MAKIMDVYIAKANAPYSEACANLSLPAMPFELFDALDKARVQQGDEMYFEVSGYHACEDCRIPQLMAAIDVADLQTVNDFAEMLQGMGDKPIRKYKAVLYAMGCDSLEEAVELAGHMDDFVFDERISSYYELALVDMKRMMGDDDAALLAQFTNLHSYGMALRERDNSQISQYGLVERDDGLPLQAPFERQTQSGMEMM